MVGTATAAGNALAAFPPLGNGKAPRSDNYAPRTVWQFHFLTGWSRTTDPISSSPESADYDDDLRRSKFCLVTVWPHEDAATSLRLYEGDGCENWLLFFDTPCVSHQIAVANLPSLLDLLGKLLPIVESTSTLDDRGDKHEEMLKARRRERSGYPRKGVRS